MDGFHPTNDGHVGNLENKSLSQLRDLLARQEKLLKMGSFLRTMPDKGERVRQFAETLRHVIQVKSGTDQIFSTPHKNGQASSKTFTSDQTHMGVEGDSEMKIEEKINTDSLEEKNSYKQNNQVQSKSSKTVSRFKASQTKEKSKIESTEKQDALQTTDGESAVLLEVTEIDVSEALGDLKLSEDKEMFTTGTGTVPVHSYELAEQRAQQNQPFLRQPLKLNSALKVDNYNDLPERFKYSPGPKDKSPGYQKQFRSPNTSRGTAPRDYESAATPPKYKYEKSKLIRLSESLELLQKQKIKQEALQAEQASERLAQRLGLKMEAYNPEGTDMSYRTDKTDDLDDSDENEKDYGD